MVGQLRMHQQVRDRLRDLRTTEPELARLVGEGMLALLDAGESLGPPLVVPPESVLRPPGDPREALDYSYQRQLEALQKVRRGVADVATSRKRVELQIDQLEQSAARLAGQREATLAAGAPDQDRETPDRQTPDRAGFIREQLAQLRGQLGDLSAEEEKLSTASQRLMAKVDAFRIQKETIKASYAAAEASWTVREAFADLQDDAVGLEAIAAQHAAAGLDRAAAAANEASTKIRDLIRTADQLAEPGEQGHDPAAQSGLLELRPGAPDSTQVGLLFAVEPEDTAVLVAWVDDPGQSREDYRVLIPLALARRATARSAEPAAATSSADDGIFLSYDADSFLDEFFPGEETEVEVGAAALVARHRAHTLAQARQRMRLTQAQVAARMNVRQERVSAIERAEPGATEVRTLAAYVSALGGRLEIVAGIGGERIRLR